MRRTSARNLRDKCRGPVSWLLPRRKNLQVNPSRPLQPESDRGNALQSRSARTGSSEEPQDVCQLFDTPRVTPDRAISAVAAATRLRSKHVSGRRLTLINTERATP